MLARLRSLNVLAGMPRRLNPRRLEIIFYPELARLICESVDEQKGEGQISPPQASSSSRLIF